MTRLEQLEARLERQEKQILDLQQEMEELAAKLPFNIPIPTESKLPDTEPFQHLFLSTYKRDKLGAADEKDEAWIEAGTEYQLEHNCPCRVSCLRIGWCRWGIDCEAFGACTYDASLYQSGQRADHWVFKSLYGLHPITACGISEHTSIA